jgi:DinB superfamily
MKNDKVLREHVLDLLIGEGAHVNFEGAVKDMPAGLRGLRPKGGAHSPWEVLEHLRIAQWDILEFVRNPRHVSPEFPGGYWPDAQAPLSEKAWEESADGFRKDLRELAALVADESTDLLAAIPHGDGKTLLREALLAADHNAYHLGEMVVLRRVLGGWS